ncbi:MAG: hypothetical protein RBS43_04955 [Candidatus Cloacimonas sp.]|jgi:hypothetical protein|nr:hypothetical protein [Candidatus Cloacimonas sp.]
MQQRVKGITQILFGEFNGIQVFLAPIALFYWIQSSTILSAATSLLSFRIHYFPLLAFLIVFSYTMFMSLKLNLFHQGAKAEFWETIIELHVSVMALILIALIVYAISGFVAYFYGITGTLKTTMYLLFKLYTALLIAYHYLLNVWLKPYYLRSYGRNRAYRALHSWVRINKLAFVRYSAFILVVVYAAVRLYLLLINYAIIPVMEGISAYTGLDLRLKLLPFMHVDDIFVNVGVLLLAFVLSNLLFYPLIYWIKQFIQMFNPIQLKAAQTKQTTIPLEEGQI